MINLDILPLPSTHGWIVTSFRCASKLKRYCSYTSGFFNSCSRLSFLNGATNPLRLMKIVYKKDGTKTYTVEELKNQKAERAFRDYQYYGPIPWDEVRFQGIEQNKGWTEK